MEVRIEVAAYVFPGDEVEMRVHENAEEVERALKAERAFSETPLPVVVPATLAPASDALVVFEVLNGLRDAAYGNARAHGFHDVGRTVGDGLMLLVTEASEAFEAFREGAALAEFRYEEKAVAHDSAGMPLMTDGGAQITVAIARKDFFPKFQGGAPDVDHPRKPVGVPSELADVIIRVLDFSGEHNVDIARAVREKMHYNRTRPHKHGGKVL